LAGAIAHAFDAGHIGLAGIGDAIFVGIDHKPVVIFGRFVEVVVVEAG
jgi:hypothetical protein